VDEEDIYSLVKDLKQSTVSWRKIKMIVLGHGGIGKTTLVDSLQRLQDPSKVSTLLLFVFHLLLTNNRKKGILLQQLELNAPYWTSVVGKLACGTLLDKQSTQ
jgi:ABC-type nitrate/sulfonate/bicarbonate transport system ATPase subunit